MREAATTRPSSCCRARWSDVTGRASVSTANYGAQTTQALMNVQQQHGVTADGAYGPATLEVMGWPSTGSGGCVSGVSAGSNVIDESS